MRKKLKGFYRGLQIKKYTTFWWLASYFSLLFFVYKYSVITRFFTGLRTDEYELIRKYLEMIFSWPVVTFVITMCFIGKFSESVKIFLENIRSLKAGPVEIMGNQRNASSDDIKKEVVENLEEKGTTFTTEQLSNLEQHINNLSNKVQTATTELQNKDQIIKYLIEKAEIFEFAYLNYYLVFNTKQALLWFNNLQLKTSTKDNFLFSCPLQIQALNIQAEKEAIFSTLLANGLIKQSDQQQVFKMTEKGERFLKYIGLSR